MIYYVILLRPEDCGNAVPQVQKAVGEDAFVCVAQRGNGQLCFANCGAAAYSLSIDGVHTCEVSRPATVFFAVSHGQNFTLNLTCDNLKTSFTPNDDTWMDSGQCPEDLAIYMFVSLRSTNEAITPDALCSQARNEELGRIKETLESLPGFKKGLPKVVERLDQLSRPLSGSPRELEGVAAGAPVALLWLFAGVEHREASNFAASGGKLGEWYGPRREGKRAIFFHSRRRSEEGWIGELTTVVKSSEHGAAVQAHLPTKAEEDLFRGHPLNDYSSEDACYEQMLDELCTAARTGDNEAVVECAWEWFEYYQGRIRRELVVQFVHRFTRLLDGLALTVQRLGELAAREDVEEATGLLSELQAEWDRSPGLRPRAAFQELRRRILGPSLKRQVAPVEAQERVARFRAHGRAGLDDNIFNTGLQRKLGEEGLKRLGSLLGVTVGVREQEEGGIEAAWSASLSQPWIERYLEALEALVERRDVQALLSAGGRTGQGDDPVARRLPESPSGCPGGPTDHFEGLSQWLRAVQDVFERAARGATTPS